jgi:diaminopropionate ammonia-lyase
MIAADYYIHKPSNQLPDTLTTGMLKRSNALPFHQSLEVYEPTPLLQLPALANQYGVGEIYVKDESHRFGLNAFKGLGPSYAIHEILKEKPGIKVFCTATDGNHGRAVAWAARQSGKEAVVFVPEDAAPARIKAIEQEGARVQKIEANYDQTCKHARRESKKEGWQLVQDTAWEGYEEIPAMIMAGYLTHFQELEPKLHPSHQPGIDLVFLQAGVGSWAASAIWYYLNRYGEKRPKMVVVEPAQSDGILESFKQGRRTAPKGSLHSMMEA